MRRKAPITAGGEVLDEDEWVPDWWHGDEAAVAEAQNASSWYAKMSRGG